MKFSRNYDSKSRELQDYMTLIERKVRHTFQMKKAIIKLVKFLSI